MTQSKPISRGAKSAPASTTPTSDGQPADPQLLFRAYQHAREQRASIVYAAALSRIQSATHRPDLTLSGQPER
jgi:hypothetical protein